MGKKLTEVKGINRALNRLNKIIDAAQGKNLVAGMVEALLYVGAASAKEVPVDTSKLLNSQYRDVKVTGNKITGRVGYSANYAKFVHDAPGKYLNTQTDRPVKAGETPGSRGVIWGPNGNPKFLYWPAQESRQEIQVILKRHIDKGRT